MTDVEFQRMRANIYRDEVLDSHDMIDKLKAEVEEQKKRVLNYVDELVESNDVIEQRDATIAIHRTMIDDLSTQNRALKGEIARIKKMLEAVLSS